MRRFINLVVAVALVALLAAPVAAQGVVEITNVSQLPVQGQLVIPAGYMFEIPKGMDGTTWYFPNTDNQASVVAYSASIAGDRVGRYGGTLASYPTVVWKGAVVPTTDRSRCRGVFDSKPGVGSPGTKVGDRDCPQMLEYRISTTLPVTLTAVPIVPAVTPIVPIPAPTITGTTTTITFPLPGMAQLIMWLCSLPGVTCSTTTP